MSRVSDAAERVEKFLREHKARTLSPEAILVEYADQEVLDLRTDDVAVLVECAQWLLMASSAELKREYATALDNGEPLDEKELRVETLDEAIGHVNGWNQTRARQQRKRKAGGEGLDMDEGFIATRLVSPWERRA
ncbi:hypothetical protein SEA_SICARIUS2_64 [Arthrobacter phage Sicarius2]|uniref:Uncharacterized protein n=1 Tax=Arthrobacter phage Sicarius2 TaxID=2836090 RepID=A0A8F3IP01_9CAUD|nr:hypothetical protein SEA_SICARIUS2_64 [Arthrobacter phage Sicarius2]